MKSSILVAWRSTPGDKVALSLDTVPVGIVGYVLGLTAEDDIDKPGGSSWVVRMKPLGVELVGDFAEFGMVRRNFDNPG